MGKIITFGNAKGGVGKTTNSCMSAYILAKRGYKVLVLDMDPQSNATSLLLKTAQRERDEVITFEKTLMSAVSDENLAQIVTSINDNLSLLPSFADFASFPKYLLKTYGADDKVAHATCFKQLLADLKHDYDFIIIDTPPTLSDFTDNAVLASDLVVIVMQTQERSYEGAVSYIKYLNSLIEEFGLEIAEFDILGILPVLLKSTSGIDQSIINRAKESFGEENLFMTVVKPMERLKRYDVSGIEDPDLSEGANKYHNQQVFTVYEDIADEIEDRIEKGGE